MIYRRKNTSVSAFVMIFMTMIQMSCTTTTPSDLSKESIIPRPVSIITTGDRFLLKENADIYIKSESPELLQVGQCLADILKPSTGFDIEVKSTVNDPEPGNIYLTMPTSNANLGNEGYELTITKNLVKLAANTPEGLFRGIQTIRQILPSDIEKNSKTERSWEIATGTVTDYPLYSYRGAMLDVARHFFSVNDVKRFIDFMACYKMNVLHLHLADDQGWRIEIKSWPNLAERGGSTQVGGGNGGYYTQEQYSEIVNYAEKRYITIIPEIDMPGHTNAALASYAELNCNGKATELYTGIKVGFSTLCTNKEITYKFVDDVVRELAGMTPGPYIHIGGDESHVTKKEDYIPFVSKVQDIVIAHGKQVIGWDEISLSSLKANSVAQYWSNAENAKRAVNQGIKLVVSPGAKAYLDMKYDSTTTLGQHWAGYIEVDTAYIWDPATLVPGIGKENVLGVEAPLWTETISNMEDMEYMVFPRLPGYAEIGWTPASMRKWDEYKVRLGEQGERFKAMGINYYKSGRVPWPDTEK
ncbi:MAG: beta-N-acetylhexosaminidase [Bacteroidales bacterium]|nr:beta-N-acetylhexosaminidase [Bacteroidales bacterium]